MAKFRPVDIRVWSDRKFLSLGDDGRMLWLFLLTTSSTLPIPGVVVAGPAALAEQIGWTPERLAKGFAELVAKGLSVRVDGRLIWLVNGLRYQKIAGPKAIAGMAKIWDDVPECDLKHDLWQALKDACKTWNRIFAKGFPEPIRYPIARGLTQEQEQEQEQEQDLDLEDCAADAALDFERFAAKVDATVGDVGAKRAHEVRDQRAKVKSEHQRALEHFHDRYVAANSGAKPKWAGQPAKLLSDLVKAYGADEVIRRTDILFDGRGPHWLNPPFTVTTLNSQWNALAMPAPARNTNQPNQAVMATLLSIAAGEEP